MSDVLVGMMTEEEFFEHYGKKGMKWGVINGDRSGGGSSSSAKEDLVVKDQVAEYEEHAKRIQSELKKAGHTDLDSAVLKAKYETPSGVEPTKGLTDKQKLALKIGVGVVAAGAIAYAVYNANSVLKLDATKVSAYADQVDGLKINWDTPVKLPKGSVIKRISTVAEKDIRPGGFFGCFLDDDVKSYSAILPSFWPQWGVGTPLKGGFINHYKAAAEVTAPSGKETMRMFKEVFDSNPNFRSNLGFAHFNADTLKNVKDYEPIFKDFSKVWVDTKSSTASTFFSKVQDNGFNALIDFNDAGKLGKTPLRVIDSSIYTIVKNEPLKLKDMIAAAKSWNPSLAHMLFSSDSIRHEKSNAMQDEKMTGMLSEDDFLAHMEVKADGMTHDEWLEHYGKKGMKWGQKLAESSLGVAAKSRNVRTEGNQGKQSKEERNAAIDKARDNIEDGTNYVNYKAAVKNAREAKGTDGHAAAKAALNAVKDKNTDDYHDSKLAKSGSEMTKVVLLSVAASVAVAAISKM